MGVPVLLVHNTENNSEASMIIGTNFMRLVKEYCIDDCNIPGKWNKAFVHFVDSSVGTVKSKRRIRLKPFEVRTVVGLVRKNREVQSFVTEQRTGYCGVSEGCDPSETGFHIKNSSADI